MEPTGHNHEVPTISPTPGGEKELLGRTWPLTLRRTWISHIHASTPRPIISCPITVATEIAPVLCHVSLFQMQYSHCTLPSGDPLRRTITQSYPSLWSRHFSYCFLGLHDVGRGSLLTNPKLPPYECRVPASIAIWRYGVVPLNQNWCPLTFHVPSHTISSQCLEALKCLNH